MKLLFKLLPDLNNKITYEFHASRDARVKYSIEGSFFDITGNIIITDFNKARILAKRINDKRSSSDLKNQLVSAGQINAFGLWHEIYHYILNYYEEKENPGVFTRALDYIQNSIGYNNLNKLFYEFVEEFPPVKVFQNKLTHFDYIEGFTKGKQNKEILLQEIFLLHFENINPAINNLTELYSDQNLTKTTKYLDLIDLIEKFFVTEKPIGKENLPLYDFLKKPLTNHPYDIEGQLVYIKDHWKSIIKELYLDRIIRSKDLLLEDYKYLEPKKEFVKTTPPVPDFTLDKELLARIRKKIAQGIELTEYEKQFYYAESENFTNDMDWMPNVVMIAKNAFVWLYQLSHKYHRTIRYLSDIPDEELDLLAGWNINALWLIGLWERSQASEKIKKIMGNPEAASSAYSLFDYVIAEELGGEDAFQNLKYRALQRGIRLASDMVPNHTGIFSKWIVEHPDYFIQSSYPPFPSYTFNSTNLSDDDRVEVRIEDKYYSRQDAAVVFQRKDTYTGDIKYIYHGNDGTSMPWNDTAQLNLLKPAVREALIQNILHVARKTPIIRFDAAMTLTKKHYQRLWFPIPGTGAAIASRSDYSLTRAAFDDAMPNEFWREVVDRINAEMPETLLLAEAFWLMESFFVRTLGMHRVYNSAFMHMLMKEENEKYRYILRSTLEMNPEILKRYVNFMSNPDEETAVNQFGKGDKYFGIAMMMATLPGLPMISHGQIEGYSEKYGMEYKKAYYNESPDEYLVKRHEAEIFPLLKKRYLFSHVYNFELYDFIDNTGTVNNNVYAYSNRIGNEKALIVYNNAYQSNYGRISNSVEKADGTSTRSISISLALSLNSNNNFYYVLKEFKTGLEYLMSGKDIAENGIFIALGGYQYYIFTEFREIYDESGEYEYLNLVLSGKGVSSVEFALHKLNMASIHNAIEVLYNPDTLFKLKNYCFISDEKNLKEKELQENVKKDIKNVVKQLSFKHLLKENEEIVYNKIIENIDHVRLLHKLIFTYEEKQNDPKWLKLTKKSPNLITSDNLIHIQSLILPKLFFRKEYFNDYLFDDRKLFDDLLLDSVFYESFERIGSKWENIKSDIALLKVLIYIRPEDGALKNISGGASCLIQYLTQLFNDECIQNYLQVNEYEGIKYFNKEKFESLLEWMMFYSLLCDVENIEKGTTSLVEVKEQTIKKLKLFYKHVDTLKLRAGLKGYDLEKFLDIKNENLKKERAKRKPVNLYDNDTDKLTIKKKIIKTPKPKNSKGKKNKNN